ncbi:Clp protease N-terminal domain-containing protein [Mycobacterium alsense]|nr:Clp protease N-terminal domain-containing protein [Mycobacterium alsense]
MQAHQEAYHYASHYLGTAHLLLALMSDGSCPITTGLQARGAGLEVIRRRFEQYIHARADQRARVVHLAYSPYARSVLIGAAGRAHSAATATAPEHLWWAMSGARRSVAAQLLAGLGQLGYLQRASAEACPGGS